MSPGLYLPGWFIAFGVLILCAAAATTVWRISVTRKIARDAGLDPDTATAVSLLGKDGIDTTYLASTLSRRPTQPAPDQAPHAKTAEQRLQELQALKDKGLVSDEEYASRRQQILDSI